MVLKQENLYSIILNNFVEKNNINKIEILNQIDDIKNAVSKYNKLIKKSIQIGKYSNKNIDFLIETKKIISKMKLLKPVETMFADLCKDGNFDIFGKVYNILLKKWNLSKIDLISAYQTTATQQKKLTAKMNKNIVKIEYKHNPLLINGEVLIVNSIKIDNSALGKLNKLSSELLN